MAHFAKIGLNNVVTGVSRIDNRDCMDPEGNFIEQLGIDQLVAQTGHETWIRCSINTSEGQHLAGGTPLRLNFPSADGNWKYDSELDGFVEIAHPTMSSFELNPATGRFEAPVPYPNDGNRHRWDDENAQWIQMDESEYYV